jgi:hypothetical protein
MSRQNNEENNNRWKETQHKKSKTRKKLGLAVQDRVGYKLDGKNQKKCQ